jgi:hypothetical protein
MPELPEKPPYRVPSMAEVDAVPWNGLTAATTFAGCGGSSLGYRMAGFRVLYANEFVEAARDTYSANKREWTVVDDRDIRSVTPESMLELMGLGRGELDLLDGSPPCASFSTAGKRSAPGRSAVVSAGLANWCGDCGEWYDGRDLHPCHERGPDYEVGDVVEYRTFMGTLRRVTIVARVDLDGSPGFDGVLVGTTDETVWGHDDQILLVEREEAVG